jgi:hypothetical protein
MLWGVLRKTSMCEPILIIPDGYINEVFYQFINGFDGIIDTEEDDIADMTFKMIEDEYEEWTH